MIYLVLLSAISYSFLNLSSKRLCAARDICFHSEIRHALELCLLNPAISWDGIEQQINRIGRPAGLTKTMMVDYQKLFWSFTHMPVSLRKKYLKSIKATPGLFAAAQGDVPTGISIDYGLPQRRSDVDQLEYMFQAISNSFAKDVALDRLDAKNAVNWVAATTTLIKEIRTIRPEEPETSIEFSRGYIDSVPNIDRLVEADELDVIDVEVEEASGNVVPFRKNAKKLRGSTG